MKKLHLYKLKVIRFVFSLKFLLIILGLILLLLLATNLLDFQMSQKAINKAFAKTNYSPDRHFLNLEEGKLHYITAGDSSRTPLLLIHGSPGSWTDFVKVMTTTDILQDYFVIAIDRPGYGKTTIPPEYALSEQAGFLEALVEEYFSNSDGIITGHSYGGALTVEAATLFNENLRGIVVIAGAVAHPYQDRRWYNYAVKYTPVKWLISDYLLTSNREMWQLPEDLQAMEEDLGKFNKKAALIQGDRDWLVDERSAEYLENLLTNAHVEVYQEEGINHFIIWTDIELILKALEWIS